MTLHGYAVDEQEDFGTEGSGDGYDGGDVEVVSFVDVVTGDDGADRFDYDGEIDRAHTDAGLDAC